MGISGSNLALDSEPDKVLVLSRMPFHDCPSNCCFEVLAMGLAAPRCRSGPDRALVRSGSEPGPDAVRARPDLGADMFRARPESGPASVQARQGPNRIRTFPTEKALSRQQTQIYKLPIVVGLVLKGLATVWP